jgi:hypothetical protein
MTVAEQVDHGPETLLGTPRGEISGGRRYRWTIAGIAVLAALCLLPTLQTGYISDDNFASLKPGVLRVANKGLAAWIVENIRTSMQEGRFYPLHWLPFNGTFCLIQDVLVYKIYILLLVASNLLLFILFLGKISGDTGFACLAASLTLMLIQLRAYHDPILSFFGLLQILVAGTLLSLLTLETYMRRPRGVWLAISVLLYLSCLLLYEASYPLFLLHALLIWRRRPELRAWARTCWPFFQAAGFCVFMSVLLRWLHPVDYSQPTSSTTHYQMNLAPGPILATLLRQTSGALPLSYFLTDPAGLFAGVKRPGALALWITRWDVLSIAVVASGVCYLSLTSKPREDGDGSPTRPDWKLLTLLGALLAVLPAVAITLTNRYQREIVFGRPYVPIYVQYFGVGLLLASAIRALSASGSKDGAAARRSRLAIALAVGLTTGLTYRANCATAVSLVSAPGTPAFNPASYDMGGAWHYQRRNLQAALHSGLLEGVPEHSKLLLANEYPYWYDAELSVLFYAMHASKVLMPVPPSARERLASRPQHGGPTYAVRDVCLGKDAGYVILSSCPYRRGDLAPGRVEDDDSEELRLFVRHPELFAYGPTPAVLLLGNASATAAKPAGMSGEAQFMRTARDLTVLKAGPDWALISLRPDAGRVDPDSLRALLGPVTAEWGDGFYEAEARREERWRWCKKSGVLIVHNPTSTPRKVTISTMLQGKGDAPLIFDCGSIHAEINPGSRPSPFTQDLTLAPGSHRVTISTDASPYAAPPRNPRFLYFRMINLMISDKGAMQGDRPGSATRLSGWGAGPVSRR